MFDLLLNVHVICGYKSIGLYNIRQLSGQILDPDLEIAEESGGLWPASFGRFKEPAASSPLSFNEKLNMLHYGLVAAQESKKPGLEGQKTRVLNMLRCYARRNPWFSSCRPRDTREGAELWPRLIGRGGEFSPDLPVRCFVVERYRKAQGCRNMQYRAHLYKFFGCNGINHQTSSFQVPDLRWRALNDDCLMLKISQKTLESEPKEDLNLRTAAQKCAKASSGPVKQGTELEWACVE